MKVLIADDDASALLLLKQLLVKLGHEPLLAADGARAWDLYTREPVRVVISDWVMPGLDGLSLCRKVRSQPGADYTYFIVLTATMVTRQDYHDAMAAGADDFMLKPPDPQMLRIRLAVAERIVTLTKRVKQLEGIIPICSYCKRVRRDDNVYEQMEAYIQENSKAVFSHGICEDCMKKHKLGHV